LFRVDVDDIELAVQSRMGDNFTSPPPKEVRRGGGTDGENRQSSAAQRESTDEGCDVSALISQVAYLLIACLTVSLPCACRRALSCFHVPIVQLLYSLAQSRNLAPLPIVPTREGVHLPPERFCLMQPNYRIKTNASKNAGESKHNL